MGIVLMDPMKMIPGYQISLQLQLLQPEGKLLRKAFALAVTKLSQIRMGLYLEIVNLKSEENYLPMLKKMKTLKNVVKQVQEDSELYVSITASVNPNPDHK